MSAALPSSPPKASWPDRLAPLWLALAYALLGVASLNLLLAPDYAVPVYPSAGLALAAVLRWGPRMLGGVALGSFLVNVLLAHQRAHFSLLGPALISLGALAQAAAGAWLVRRWLGRDTTLTEPRDLLRFFGASAGLAGLISPSMGVGSLWLLGAIGPQQLLPHWLAWWAGDAIGVLLGAPIALTLFGRPREVWAPRRRSVALPLLLASLLLSLATLYVMGNEQARRRHAFERDAGQAAHVLEAALRQPLGTLEATHGLFMVAPELSRQDFERASAARIRADLLALGWAPRLTPQAHRQAFELRARAEGYAGYQLRERGRPGDLAPEPGADMLPIRLILPLPRNSGALGVNIRNVPPARAAQDRAIASGQAQASEAFVLSQDQDGLGVVVYRAVYDEAPGDPWQDPTLLRGLVFIALRPEALLREAAVGLPPGLGYCLLDRQASARRIAGAADCPDERKAYVRALNFAGRDWELRLWARDMSGAGGATLPFALAGLVGTALLGLLLLTVSGRSTRVAQLVQERTRELRESELRFRSIVEHAPVGLVFADLQGRPQEINPAFCQLLGYSAEQLKERSILAITHPDDRAEDLRLARALLAGEIDRYSRHKRYLDAGGQVLQVRASVSLLRDPQGRPHRLVGIVEDMAEELRLQQVEREHAAVRAADQAKSEFLSRMSHELRTPLNAMLGFAQLLEIDRQPALAERQRNWAQQIQRAGWHLLQMINDTLDLSRLEVGQLHVQTGPQDLARLVQDSLALVEPARAQRGIHVSLDLPGPACRVRADATRLTQVLSNLFSNGIKYNREGGELRISARLLEAGRMRLDVADTGPGLSTEQQAQLFQPFNRLGREHGAIEGTGIGLVIAKRLLELMDGQLSVTSSPGQGAVFSVDLPLDLG